MAITLMLSIKGRPNPTAVQVTAKTFERFRYLEDMILYDENIPDFIIAHDEKRAEEWNSLDPEDQTFFLDLWAS